MPHCRFDFRHAANYRDAETLASLYAGDIKPRLKSNIHGRDRRGKGVQRELTACRELYLEYFDRAIAAEPPGSARRRELLLERAAMFPGKGRRNARTRLRRCHCGRFYEASLKVRRSWHTKLCPECRRVWRKTASGLRDKALRNAADSRQRLQRIRNALGDRENPAPLHCQHGQCRNERHLRLTPGRPGAKPRWLCPRHRWAARRELARQEIRPRPRGRPHGTA